MKKDTCVTGNFIMATNLTYGFIKRKNRKRNLDDLVKIKFYWIAIINEILKNNLHKYGKLYRHIKERNVN